MSSTEHYAEERSCKSCDVWAAVIVAAIAFAVLLVA